MSHLLVALVLLDMLEHGDESLLERRLPKLMVFYNGLLDYWRIPYISISMGTFGHRKYKSRGEDGNK